MRTAIFSGLCFIAYAINKPVMMEYDMLVFKLFVVMVICDVFTTAIKLRKQ